MLCPPSIQDEQDVAAIERTVSTVAAVQAARAKSVMQQEDVEDMDEPTPKSKQDDKELKR